MVFFGMYPKWFKRFFSMLSYQVHIYSGLCQVGKTVLLLEEAKL